jgi:hypothetical protein
MKIDKSLMAGMLGVIFFSAVSYAGIISAELDTFEVSGPSVFKSLESIVPEAPNPSPEIASLAKANRTAIYATGFSTKVEAESALQGIVGKFESSGCVVFWSRVDFDEYGRNTWIVRLSYLPPSGLTAEIYSGEFSDLYAAKQSLPGIVKKFENAGYTVLNSWTSITVDGSNGKHYISGLSYFSPNGVRPEVYNAGFPTKSDAEQALPGLVKKFEGAGYVVVNSWALLSGHGNWSAGVAYILPR